MINTLHGFYFDENSHPARRRFYITTEKIAARCSDVILSQNRADIQTAIQEYICPETTADAYDYFQESNNSNNHTWVDIQFKVQGNRFTIVGYGPSA